MKQKSNLEKQSFKIRGKSLILNKTNDHHNYFYYKTITKIKDKYQVFGKTFTQNLYTIQNSPKKILYFTDPNFQSTQYTYNIEKINHKMFKIHKNSLSFPRKTQSPQRSQTQTLNFNMQFHQKKIRQQRPSLNDIISKHRQIQRSYRERRLQTTRQSRHNRVNEIGINKGLQVMKFL